MAKRKHYKTLEIEENATKSEIEKAYRKLTRKWHPDVWSNSTEEEKKQASEKMNEINQAYFVLSNKEKRQEYDIRGDDRSGGSAYSSGFGGFTDFTFNDINDIFGNGFFNFSGGKKSYTSSDFSYKRDSYKGEDILISLELDFKESVLGTKKKVSLNIKEACFYCKQRGYLKESDISICYDCKGKGVVNLVISSFIRTQRNCSTCSGTGKILKNKCSYCKGSFFLKKSKTIELTIPKGIQPERRLKYRGQGNDGLNSEIKGDLLVDLKVKKDNYFSRKNNDIYVNLPISFLDAILGGEVFVYTLENIKSIKIQSGIQNGDFYIIKGEGCYLKINDSSSRGNFYVVFQIKIPSRLSLSSDTLLKKLREEINWDPNKEFIEKNENIIR